MNSVTISSLGFSMSLALRYWNSPTAINRSLAANSYDIYLSRYPCVFLFQLILFTLPGIYPLLKLFLVLLASISSSYLTSQYLKRPYSRLTIAATTGLFLILVIGIRVKKKIKGE
ncbi:MAG: hypothetical protein JW932_03700 [Deltaproteobacteria bacterium]|nr:hypothetical protein [Deltaproteobacteria bacterium]